MAIDNIHQHFLDIIKQNQLSTDELANIYVHELEFRDQDVEDVIYNSTIKALKSIDVFSGTRQNKRSKHKTVKMTAFELSSSDTAKYEQRLKDLAKDARKVVFTKSNIEKVYSKHFKHPLKMSPDNFLQFPQGVYGREIENNKRARHLAQREIAVQGVKEVLKDFVEFFEEETKSINGFYTGYTSKENQEKIDKINDMASGDKDVPVRVVDSHSTEGHDTTTATVNAMKNLAEADTKIAQIIGSITDKYDVVATTRNKMFTLFDEFEVQNTKITDIVKAGSGKVKDNLVIKLQYGTDKLNRTMSKKDRDGIKEKLDSIAEKQLKILKNQKLDKRTKRYKQLKGSKSFDERLVDGAVNATVDMIEGVKKTSRGVKITKGKKVKAKKKQTNVKKTAGKIINRKRSIQNVRKVKKLREEKLVGSGKYSARNPESTTSLASLMQMINAELPRFLQRNMVPPRLQYRGRGNPTKPFAGPFNTGVQVTSLTDSKSNAGGLNVHYTYEKYPYQTFEPGFEQGSRLRDPRELIKESIRQIMIQNKQNRFLRFRRH